MEEALFVLRRAWLIGRCRRSDVDAAFDTQSSPNRASKIIQEAVGRFSEHLFYAPRRGVFPNTRAQWPKEARAEVILDLLAHGAPAAQTGLFEHDGVPFLLPQPKPAYALTDTATQAVLDAALHDTILDILYVGLRRGEKARWRRVWPRAMEYAGWHWRLHAQDLDDSAHSYPIKTYLLARIMDAKPVQPSQWTAPEDFQPRKLVRTESHLRVHLSDALTPDQLAVIRNQFGIQGDRMTWPTHALYAFRREFTNTPVPPDVVWPVIARVDEID